MPAYFLGAERIQGPPGASCRMKWRTSATPQPKTMATGNMYRMTGMPTRKISMLPATKIAPAMPPPTANFDMLICGFEVSSFILHPLISSYHELTPPEVRERSALDVQLCEEHPSMGKNNVRRF